MDLKVDVDGIDSTLNEIKRDLHRGMENSVDALVDNAKNRAREVITQNEAIFNAEVYKGFKDAETSSSPSGVSAKVYNSVEHADALEHGAEYGDKGPPVEALLPWVARKMRVGSSFDPDAYRGSDDDGGGPGDGDSDSGGTSSGHIEDEETIDAETLEEDTTDNGLNLSKQAGDLAIDSGNLPATVDERAARETLFRIENWQQVHGMPKVDLIDAGRYDTVEEAFDDSSTITLPHTLLEFDTEFTGANFEDLFDKDYFNVTYDSHLDYVINHQYGRYVYENLNETGLDEFRRRFGFTETDSGWELPDDAIDVSELATTGEKEYFAEVFIDGEKGEFGWKEKDKRDYFEKILSRDSEYYNDTFLSKSNDTLDYTVGYDYTDGQEVVPEEEIAELSTRDTESFTTDFNALDYLSERDLELTGYSEWQEYVFTSADGQFEGSKVLSYNDGKFLGENNYEYDRKELTLQGISEKEAIFNQLESGTEVILERPDDPFDDNENYISAEIKTSPRNILSARALDAENVFTDEITEVNRGNVVGLRKNNQDLWADGYEIVQTVGDSEIDEPLTTQFDSSEISSSEVHQTIDEVGHFLIEDDSGDTYRAVVNPDNIGDEFKSLHPNESGDHLTWAYDYSNPDENDVTISHINEQSAKYNNIQTDDDIFVNPDSLSDESSFTDSTYRATVKGFDIGGTPYVVPFGQNTNDADIVNYESFVDSRENLPGWNSKNWDVGRKVTIEDYNGNEITGRLESLEPTYGDNKNYEAGQMTLIADGSKERKYFTAEDVTSSESDDFMERFTEKEIPPDLTGEFSPYDGDIQPEDLKASEYDPLEDADKLEVGTQISFKKAGNLQHEEISHVRDLSDDFFYEAGGYTKIYPEDVESFEGAGVDLEDVSVGDTISTGSSFGEITEITDNGGLKIDFNGDGEMDDLLNTREVQTIDTKIPTNSKVYFFSHREGKYKAGTVKSNNYGLRIETESGERYDSDSSTYPITIFGVNI